MNYLGSFATLAEQRLGFDLLYQSGVTPTVIEHDLATLLNANYSAGILHGNESKCN